MKRNDDRIKNTVSYQIEHSLETCKWYLMEIGENRFRLSKISFRGDSFNAETYMVYQWGMETHMAERINTIMELAFSFGRQAGREDLAHKIIEYVGGSE